MERLVAISRVLDWPSRLLGPTLPWLVAAVVLLKFLTVELRYVFYAHATLFMLMVGYTYLRDEHVRVDMFYDRMTARGKAWVDLLCVLFGVLPLCVMLAWFGWPYVRAAWAIREGALFFGGLPGTYLLKTVILVFVVLLVLQSLAIALRCIAVIAGGKVAVFDTDPERAD